jgi:membrane protease YdiL (CAAX protease family)
MLLGSIIAIGMLLFGLQLEDLFKEASPLLEIILSLLAFTLATFIARRVIDRRSFTSLGFDIDSQTIKDLLVGFAIPGLLMGGIFLFEWAVGWLSVIDYAWEIAPISNWLPDLFIWFIVYIAVGFQEELLSRGYHLQNIAEGLTLPMGILISSLIFALLHLGNPFSSLSSFIGLLAAGYFLAFAWVRTRQLWLPIGLHIGWNFFEGNIFGFPVSGTDTFKLIRHEVTGPKLITGGDFGPEAGLIVLPAMLLGTYLIYLYTNREEIPKTRLSKSQSS